MKIIVIGDVHGKNCWKDIIPSNYDKIIFLGDYLDSFTISKSDQISNFFDILSFKKDFPDKVVLLLGNHDMHYVDSKYKCSGFDMMLYMTLNLYFHSEKHLFQVAYQVRTKKRPIIFTHAGITRGWYTIHAPIFKDLRMGLIRVYGKSKASSVTLASVLNAVYDSRHRDILNDCGSIREGLNDYSGPMWADVRETNIESYSLSGYDQIVGHTHVKEINRVDFKDSSITYCDVLDTKTEFLELEV